LANYHRAIADLEYGLANEEYHREAMHRQADAIY
jgi:hypothetical protein